MSIKIGNLNIADVKIGDSQISSIYAGTNLIWSAEPWVKGLALNTSLTAFSSKTVKYGEPIDGKYPFTIAKPEVVNARLYGLSNVETILPTKLVTSKWTTLYAMFALASQFKDIDTSLWDLSNITNVEGAFNCGKLITLHRTLWDLPKCSYFREMFKNCSVLTDDIKIVSNITVSSCYGLFQSCKKIQNIDLTGLDFSNVKEVQYMFLDCNSLTNLQANIFVNCKNWTNAKGMFSGCNLLDIDLPSIIELNNCECASMFKDCSSLTTIPSIKGTITNADSIFLGCTGLYDLTTLDLSNIDFSKCTNINYLLQGFNKLTTKPVLNFSNNPTVTTSCKYAFNRLPYMPTINGKIKASDLDAFMEFNTGGDFFDCSIIDTSECTNMTFAFYRIITRIREDGVYKPRLTGLDTWDTSKVTSMSYMFQQGNSQLAIGEQIKNWDVSKVKDFTSMFRECNPTDNLNFNWDTSSDTNGLSNMFMFCYFSNISVSNSFFNTNYSNITAFANTNLTKDAIRDLLTILLNHPKKNDDSWWDRGGQTIVLLAAVKQTIRDNNDLLALVEQVGNETAWNIPY